MTLEFCNKIPTELVIPIEDYLCELEEPHWVLLRVTENDDYKLQGYFESATEGEVAWAQMCERFPGLPEVAEQKTIEDKDWQNAYKEYLKPWSSRGLHWVPIWEKEAYALEPSDLAIYFDAGMAFGTGAHETTRLCAERLLDYRERVGADALKGKSVIDAGCGSGILALSAAAMGFGPVRGFDIDPEAVSVSEENARDNGLEHRVKWSVSGLEEGLAGEPVDVVLANILANVLCAHKECLVSAVKPGGVLVLSGILKEEAAKVIEVFEPLVAERWKTYRLESHSMGEWTDILFANGA